MAIEFAQKGIPLTQAAIDAAGARLGADVASVWSLLAVETRGFGFLADRRPQILFERHIFHARTQGRFSAGYPDLSAKAAGGYAGAAAEYGRLHRAMQLDRKAALESTSWGMGQVMGFNAVKLGYADVEDMVASFVVNEDQQLEGTVRFIEREPALKQAFDAHVWARVAYYYNGESYAINEYDKKLAEHYAIYAAGHLPDIRLRAAQASLLYLGFDPHGVDGLIGKGTRTALLNFQQARGLAPTAELDEVTAQALLAGAFG